MAMWLERPPVFVVFGMMLKEAVQHDRSARGGDAHSSPYVEPLSNARTPLAEFFSILLQRFDAIGQNARLRILTENFLSLVPVFVAAQRGEILLS